MKFAVLIDEQVASVHVGHKEAVKAMEQTPDRNKYVESFAVMPIMTMEEYGKEPKDYKGCMYGRPCVLYLESGTTGATVYGPVYLIESWNSYQICDNAERHVPYKELIQE